MELGEFCTTLQKIPRQQIIPISDRKLFLEWIANDPAEKTRNGVEV